MSRLSQRRKFLEGPLQAADLVINQYEETGSGQNSQLRWSMASSNVEIPEGLDFVSVNELRGELFCNGKGAYRLYGHATIIRGMDQSSSSFQVQGELEFTALLAGANIKCRTLAWESTTETLTLGGNVKASFESDVLVVSPELVIRHLGSFENIQRKIPQSGPIRGLQQLDGFLLFQGPCHIKMKAPFDTEVDRFLDISKGYRFLLRNVGRALCFVRRLWMPPDRKVISIEPVSHNIPKINGLEKCSWTGKEIYVDTKDGMHIDVAEGHASLKGPLSISWPEKDMKLCAGGAEIRLKDGTYVLHSQVAAQIQSLKVKASKITWLACQKPLEAESLVFHKCHKSKASAPLRKTSVRCAVGDKCSLENGSRKLQDLPCSSLSRGILRSLRGSTGLVCQWTNYPKPRSGFSSELRHVVYGDNKFRNVIPMTNMIFSSFSAMLHSCLCGFFSACKVSFTSTRSIKSAGFFVGIEVQLWEFPVEKQEGSSSSGDESKHFVPQRVRFCDSTLVMEKSMEDRVKYCRLFNCRNLIVAEGNVEIS